MKKHRLLVITLLTLLCILAAVCTTACKPSQEESSGGDSESDVVVLADIALKSAPGKTEYTVGDELILDGAVITATYSDSSTKDINVTTAMISGYDKAVAGEQTVVISYTEGEITKQVTFKVTVSKPEPKTIYKEDFSDGAGALADYISVNEKGVGLITADNVAFNLPEFALEESNNYEISFDFNIPANESNMTFFVHLLGYNGTSGGSIYLAIQTDGYVCLNTFLSDGLHRCVYNFNTNFGGCQPTPLVWNDAGTTLYKVRMVIYEGFIEVWINGQKYLATHLSDFGGINSPSVALEEGKLTGILMHATAGNIAEIDNIEIKQVFEGRDSFTLERGTTDSGYPINKDYSVVDLNDDDFKVEAEFDVVDITGKDGNISLNLFGLNKVVGMDVSGATNINVQFNFAADGTMTPVLYYCDISNQWHGINGTAVSVSNGDKLKITFYVYGDRLIYLINDQVVVDTTFTENGMVKGKLHALGLVESAGTIEYNTYSYSELTESDIQNLAQLNTEDPAA